MRSCWVCIPSFQPPEPSTRTPRSHRDQIANRPRSDPVAHPSDPTALPDGTPLVDHRSVALSSTKRTIAHASVQLTHQSREAIRRVQLLPGGQASLDHVPSPTSGPVDAGSVIVAGLGRLVIAQALPLR